MSENRSDTLFHSYFASLEKFDYFITGIISAVLTYLVQNIKVGSLASIPSNLNLLSLALLLFAMYYAFIRIEKALNAKKFNAEMLHCLEAKGKLVNSLANASDTSYFINEETGDRFSRATAVAIIEKHDAKIKDLRNKLTEEGTAAITYYRLRNNIFLIGFALLVLSKILSSFL